MRIPLFTNLYVCTVILLASASSLSACGSSPAPAGNSTANSADALGDSGSDTGSGDTLGSDGGSDIAKDAGATSQLSKDINAFCDPWATWACDRAMQCGCSTPKNGPLTKALCAAAMKASCAKDTAAVGGAIAQGIAAIDPAQVGACIAWLDQQLPACVVGGLKAMGPGPCRQWLVQLPGPKGECVEDNLRCADGSACSKGQCGGIPQELGSSCSGASQCKSLACQAASATCIAPKAFGDSCSGEGECPLLSACNQGKCSTPAKQGQACTATDDCAPMLACTAGKCAPAATTCDAKSDCGAGGSCLGEVFNSCQAKFQVGHPCSQDSQCGGSTWCDPASQTCAALPASGSPCANGVLCGPGLGCNSETSVCEPLPTDGKPCAMGEFGPMLCAAGLVCKTDAFVCAAPPAEGAPCNAHANCSPSAGKDPGSLVCAFGPNGSSCVKRQALGAKCENDICQDGLYCDYKSNSCANAVAAGGKCSAGNECGAQGSCVPDNQGQLRCVPLPKAGEACLFDCGEGLFCDKGMKNSTCQAQVCQLFYQLN